MHLFVKTPVLPVDIGEEGGHLKDAEKGRVKDAALCRGTSFDADG